MSVKKLLQPAKSFHNIWLPLFPILPSGPTTQTVGRWVAVQDRNVGYRAYLHEHPYAKELTRKAVTAGVRGLQDADTEVAPGNLIRPGTIDVALPRGALLTLPAGATLKVLGLPAGAADGTPAPGETVTLAVVADTEAPESVTMTLVGTLPELPDIGDSLQLPLDTPALAGVDVDVVLKAATAVQVPGHPAPGPSLPAGTRLRLRPGCRIVLPVGTARLVDAAPRPALYDDLFSKASYAPSPRVDLPYPMLDLDFTSSGAYSAYNWELFFHAPLTIAIQLSKNQRFAEAQRWLHYIFDPTSDADLPVPDRFWKVLPFETTDVVSVSRVLANLATGDDPFLQEETSYSINAWKKAPFQPHVVAQYRPQAYMYKAVMAYLDNLIGWGDHLFAQDTPESVDESLQLYMLASQLLGPRPQQVPRRTSPTQARTYAQLRPELDKFGNAMQQLESELPFDVITCPSTTAGGDDARLSVLRSIARGLYFCVPRNDKLTGYWDSVADRLFKIHNSLSLQGQFRQLPLFEPPIDPALLARAVAAGVDVSSAISDLSQPMPLVRFALLLQKAQELTGEVRSLGAAILAAMEKQDAEALALLRSRHELDTLDMAEHIRYDQVQEAVKAREALDAGLEAAIARYRHAERQLGTPEPDIEIYIPKLKELDLDALYKMTAVPYEPPMAVSTIDYDIVEDLGVSQGKIVSSHERAELVALASAHDQQDDAAHLDMIAKVLSLIPENEGAAKPVGIGLAVVFGGRALSLQLSLVADSLRTHAATQAYQAGNSARIGGYARRMQDWKHQSNTAVGEIMQIHKQLRAAQIREAMARHELKHNGDQKRLAREVQDFLNEADGPSGKATNKAFYLWLKGELKHLHAEAFRLAQETARKAERALQRELGDSTLTFVRPAVLAGKDGLLAGDRLQLDLRRMEVAYHDLNRREYEMTKHVSLLQLDPMALLELRAAGSCEVTIPEELFDLDGPGQYFRRIRSVSLSIPCVTGPYTGVGCKLTLVSSKIRTRASLDGTGGNTYVETNDDNRFDYYYGNLQSVVTSSAQQDSGVLAPVQRDDRLLPFEGSGAVSRWRIELPADPRKDDAQLFDYDTISDVVIHIHLTARDGGQQLRGEAKRHLRSQLKQAAAAGNTRLFSVRDEFPLVWETIRSGNGGPVTLDLPLRPEHYPYWTQVVVKRVNKIELRARGEDPITAVVKKGDKSVAQSFTTDPATGYFGATFDGAAVKDLKLDADQTLNLSLNKTKIEDLWLAVSWANPEPST